MMMTTPVDWAVQMLYDADMVEAAQRVFRQSVRSATLEPIMEAAGTALARTALVQGEARG
jgi:hypothetical protein